MSKDKIGRYFCYQAVDLHLYGEVYVVREAVDPDHRIIYILRYSERGKESAAELTSRCNKAVLDKYSETGSQLHLLPHELSTILTSFVIESSGLKCESMEDLGCS